MTALLRDNDFRYLIAVFVVPVLIAIIASREFRHLMVKGVQWEFTTLAGVGSFTMTVGCLVVGAALMREAALHQSIFALRGLHEVGSTGGFMETTGCIMALGGVFWVLPLDLVFVYSVYGRSREP